jgi:N-acetylmuramoyl-L-alanine amidase
VSRSLNKEIISRSCIVLIILLSQLVGGNICNAESKINTNRKIIVIDPGHGGKDTGVTVNSTLYEKTCTLTIGKLTAGLLKNKYNVLLTRDRDSDISLLKRTSHANVQKADIFISLHAKKRGTGGFIIFEPSARVDLLDTKSPLTWEKEQLQQIKNSKNAAKILARQFSKKYHVDYNILSAPAIVLQGAQMPAVIVEVLSMEDIMGETNYEATLQKHAQILAEGLEKILQ